MLENMDKRDYVPIGKFGDIKTPWTLPALGRYGQKAKKNSLIKVGTSQATRSFP